MPCSSRSSVAMRRVISSTSRCEFPSISFSASAGDFFASISSITSAQRHVDAICLSCASPSSPSTASEWRRRRCFSPPKRRASSSGSSLARPARRCARWSPGSGNGAIVPNAPCQRTVALWQQSATIF